MEEKSINLNGKTAKYYEFKNPNATHRPKWYDELIVKKLISEKLK